MTAYLANRGRGLQEGLPEALDIALWNAALGGQAGAAARHLIVHVLPNPAIHLRQQVPCEQCKRNGKQSCSSPSPDPAVHLRQPGTCTATR